MQTYPPRTWARILAWLIAVATLIVGLVLVPQRNHEIWQQIDAETYEVIGVIDLSGVGLALLCTGIVCVMALLIVEMLSPPRPAPLSLEEVPEEKAVVTGIDSAGTRTTDNVQDRLRTT